MNCYLVTKENETYFMHFKREILIVLNNCLFETKLIWYWHRTRYFPENCYIVSKRQIFKTNILGKSIYILKNRKSYANLHYSLLCRIWSSGKEDNPLKARPFSLGSISDICGIIIFCMNSFYYILTKVTKFLKFKMNNVDF